MRRPLGTLAAVVMAAGARLRHALQDDLMDDVARLGDAWLGQRVEDRGSLATGGRPDWNWPAV